MPNSEFGIFFDISTIAFDQVVSGLNKGGKVVFNGETAEACKYIQADGVAIKGSHFSGLLVPNDNKTAREIVLANVIDPEHVRIK